MTTDGTRFLIPQEPYPCWKFFKVFSSGESFRGSASETKVWRFFLARNAIYHALRALNISPGAHVLLPAYLCKAAVEPVLAYGAKVQFYRIDRNCRADFSDIESKIDSRTEAILAVHYFGFPHSGQTFRDLCDQHNLALIEDCAHSCPQNAVALPMGSYGDASVFSCRKFLPLYDGGELRLRGSREVLPISWRKESLSFSLRAAKDGLDRMLEFSTSIFSKSTVAAIKLLKSAWNWFSRVTPQDRGMSIQNNCPSFDASSVDMRMSRISRWLLRHSDVASVIERRRQNYLYLATRLSSLDGVVQLFPDLPMDVCPWVFPLWMEGLPGAHRLLRAEGIPATAWDSVRPEGLSYGVFPDADFLYENLAFLPIHQNLTQNSLDLIVAAVQRIHGSAVARRSEQYAAS